MKTFPFNANALSSSEKLPKFGSTQFGLWKQVFVQNKTRKRDRSREQNGSAVLRALQTGRLLEILGKVGQEVLLEKKTIIPRT